MDPETTKVVTFYLAVLAYLLAITLYVAITAPRGKKKWLSYSVFVVLLIDAAGVVWASTGWTGCRLSSRWRKTSTR